MLVLRRHSHAQVKNSADRPCKRDVCVSEAQRGADLVAVAGDRCIHVMLPVVNTIPSWPATRGPDQ